MGQKLIGLNLIGAMAFLIAAPIVYAQYAGPQSQSPYPPPPAGYPQTGYPQSGYPQNGYPQNGYPPQGGYSQPANGQPESQGDADAFDPQRGVARISIAQGDVNVKRGDTGGLVAAATNAPLMGQDHLQTSDGSRAEVEFDYGNAVRLAPDTDLVFADVEYHKYQVQLAAGTIIYRVIRNVNSQAEIDTPSVAVHPVQLGEYRVSVMPDGTTQLTVHSGQLEIYSPQGTQTLGPGQAMLVRGTQQSPEFQMTYASARDQFDGWSEQRDAEMLASRTYQHVSPEIYGADDLDQYGNWVPSQYGQVWAPQPPNPGWTPYSDGQWVWEGYYGWTWVDNAPWGWAPFHYGSWFWNVGVSRWCWFPGGIAGGLFWRPALVGFFGLGGRGFGIGFGGFGGLGWVALAPFEHFHPWYGRGFFGGGSFGRPGFANVERNVNIFNNYRNAGIQGAVRTSSLNGFGGPGQRFGIASRQQLNTAGVFRGQIPVSASRASMQFSNRQAVGNSRFNGLSNRSFFEHSRPGQVQAGFSSRNSGQQGFRTQQASPQNNFSNRPTTPTMRGGSSGFEQSRGYAAGQSGGGWQRFGQPSTSNAPRAGGSPNEESGWHRFGQPQPRSTPSPGYNAGSSAYGFAQRGGGSYQSRPFNQAAPENRGFGGGNRGSYSAPPQRFSQPSQRESAPQHNSAPRGGGGGGNSHSGGGSRSGGGSHGGGGGGRRK
jgi:hypothetical protein